MSLLTAITLIALVPARAFADEPQSVASGDTCATNEAACVVAGEPRAAVVPAEPSVIPSRASEIASGHGDQSFPFLASLGLAAVAGLVVSSLYHLSRED